MAKAGSRASPQQRKRKLPYLARVRRADDARMQLPRRVLYILNCSLLSQRTAHVAAHRVEAVDGAIVAQNGNFASLKLLHSGWLATLCRAR